ncbi:hypothetical protein BASA81_011741 [Batrachochytrium salamandrivorans]|nr:hypothetical protein BASA81_011741 [Batrachochytrium salamandrivorans]
MRLSTGIILSVLSAIKRNNGQDDEDQEEQAKPKVSVPNPDSSQAGPVYDNLVSEDDFNPDPNSNLDTGEGSTDSVAYDPNQDRGATGGNKDVHTSLVPNQGRLSFADAFRGSSSRVLGRIRQGLSRKKHEFELSFSSKHQISAVSKAVKSHFGGEKGDEIGNEVHALFFTCIRNIPNLSNTVPRLCQFTVQFKCSLLNI